MSYRQILEDNNMNGAIIFLPLKLFDVQKRLIKSNVGKQTFENYFGVLLHYFTLMTTNSYQTGVLR